MNDIFVYRLNGDIRLALKIVEDRYAMYSPIYRIERDDMDSEAGLFGAFKDLTEAFDRYLANRESDNYAGFSTEFCNGGKLFTGADSRENKQVADRYDSVRAFYDAFLNRPALSRHVNTWLDKMLKVLSATPTYDAIFETEEYQLGELLTSTLALSDIEWVPTYAKFLAQWDLDHEVLQSKEIAAIFDCHGVCQETEDLLYCRTVTNRGQHGHDDLDSLFPVLQAHFGDFTQTLLFRSIVKDLYDKKVAWFEEVTAEGGKASFGRPLMTYNPAMREASEAIVTELGIPGPAG